ncbi:Glycosylphosphatidylinositol anchor attachment 1 protein [Quillaja saponaria]|uniref:Glycosylphosphatidylinositol anchor attachment 1 protein n=1 Tax=Quillaja saponaria TaxID=32244 RepID=A0AAD7M8I3_QUISA|nr:Glycosylphosphatidylinositol anchor attachment 1 protein [Quillaja saponaria]
MAESNTSKRRTRPIVRLGILLISHSLFFSVVCCIAGVLALLLLPILAKNTYISENALMPGSANTMLSSQDVSEASRLLKDLTDLEFKPEGTGIESQRLIAQYMSNLGAEVTIHKFNRQFHQFHPLHFFTSPDSGAIWENISCSSHGMNTVGIIRAPRGDGKEAIVLVTPYNSVKVGNGEALSLGIAYSVFSLLSKVTWLSKDIIWLVADSQHGEYDSVAAWLRDYHTPVFSGVGTINAETCKGSKAVYELKQKSYTERKIYDDFRRAGTMAAALVIKVTEESEPIGDSLSISAEASNGQMPNLDLINIVNYLAVHRQGLRVKVKKMWSLLDSKWLNLLGELFESIGQVARSLNLQWKFGVPAADYVEGTATLASSLFYQAMGVPTGPHGAFRDYQVDAITLEISPRISPTKMVRHKEFLLRAGRLIEGVVRSVNNLLEKFHQSFFLYLLTSPSKFVSVGVYMIAFAILVASLPVVAASLYVDANSVDSNSRKEKSSPPATLASNLDITRRSWKWLNSAKNVFVVHLWGAVVSLLPYYICQIPNCSPTVRLAVWVLLSMFSLVTLNFIFGSPFSHDIASQLHKEEWAHLKSMTISAAFIGLCLMSVINFATAELGALLIVPMCLIAQPLKLDVKAGSLRTLMRTACSIILGFIGFPPAAYFLLKVVFEGSSNINVGDFWTWVESLWAWNSATYLFIGMVHLPCWALCIHILFHPC